MAKNQDDIQCEHCQTTFSAPSSGLLLSLVCPSCCRPTSAMSIKRLARDAKKCAYCLNPRPAVEPTSFPLVDNSRVRHWTITWVDDVPRCSRCKRIMRTISTASVLLALMITSGLAFYFDFIEFSGMMDRALFVVMLTPLLGFGVSRLATFPQRSNAKAWLGVN